MTTFTAFHGSGFCTFKDFYPLQVLPLLAMSLPYENRSISNIKKIGELLHSIDRPVLDSFGNMGSLEVFFSGKVGDRPGNFEDSIASSGR